MEDLPSEQINSEAAITEESDNNPSGSKSKKEFKWSALHKKTHSRMWLRNRKSNAPLALNSDEAWVRTETDDFNTAGSVQPPPKGMRTIIHTEGEQDLSEKDPARSEAFAQI